MSSISPYHVNPPENGASPRPSFDASAGSVSDDAIRAYETDGVVCLRGVVDPSRMSELIAGCAMAESVASELSYRVGGDGGPSFFYDINVSERVNTFKELRDRSRIPDIAQQLMRSDTLGFYFDNLFIKDGNGGAPTPWHEDATFQRINGTHALNFWTAFDQIPSATALQFLAGSHLRDEPIFVMNTHFDENQEYEAPITDNRTPMPRAEDLTSRFELIWWELEAGDALVWSQRMLHAAPGNTIDRPRRALSYVFTGDDAWYNAAPGATDPNIRDDALSEGDHVRSVVFPRIR